jgi:hypothetical protein
MVKPDIETPLVKPDIETPLAERRDPNPGAP